MQKKLIKEFLFVKMKMFLFDKYILQPVSFEFMWEIVIVLSTTLLKQHLYWINQFCLSSLNF